MTDTWSNKNGKPVSARDAFAQVAGLPVQSEIAISGSDAEAAQVRRPLTFDVSKYMPFVEGSELSDAEAKELLESLWAIVVGFVDLGFEVSPIQQAMDKSQAIEGRASPVVVSSSERQFSTGKTKRRDAAMPLVPGMRES